MNYKNIIFLFILPTFSCEKLNNNKAYDRCFVAKYSNSDIVDEGSLCFIECLNFNNSNTIVSNVECKEWFGERVFVKKTQPKYFLSP